MMTRPLSLVADIGGTNTRVATACAGKVDRSSIRRFSNADHDGLGQVLRAFVNEHGPIDCASACVAVAGPVENGNAILTNLDWRIDGDAISTATGAARVAIINDLQAQGHALGLIDAAHLRSVIAGPAHPDGVQLVIGVGTGFNAAPVQTISGARVVSASECGHMTLPVRSKADLALMQFVETAHGFAGVEDVLSGRGLERLYAFHAKLAGTGDQLTAAAIMAAINDDPVAEATGRCFLRLLGTVAGDLALIHLPFGGIHLVGGVARAFAPYFQTFGFAEAFRDKGRFADFMKDFTVSVIEDDYAALEGCAAYLSSGAA
ncbi:MAG: glucokinase [Albidovulum sp.]